MARQNKLGTSFCSLGLEQDEEEKLKAHLKKKKWSAKRYIRFLVRTDLNFKVNINEKD